MAPKFLEGFSNYKGLLRNRQYRKQWIAGAISNTGTRVHWIALLVLVFEMTGKALDLGVLMICMSIPALLLAPAAGILIDRIDRKMVLVTADFARAALVFVIPFATELWQIYVIAGALGACGTFFQPAILATVPKLVPEDELVTANSLQMTTRNVVSIIAPAAAGLLVAHIGTTFAFWFDSVTYLVSGILIWTITTSLKPERKAGEEKRNVIGEIKLTARTIKNDKALLFVFTFLAAHILLTTGIDPLFIVLTKRVLMQGAEQYGFLISAFGIGGILGGFIYGAIGNRFGRIPLVVNLMFIEAVAVLLVGVLPLLLPVPFSYYGVLAALFIYGVVITISMVNIITLLQERVPDNIRGKFFAAFGVVSDPLRMLSMGGYGYLADRIKLVFLFIGAGVIELLLVVAARFLPVYRRIKGEPAPEEESRTQ